MSLAPGTRLGGYEILAAIGAGGMGEVYRARDTRLNRIVAIKALHQLFESHPERVARFDREAQLLASLNHPNIAAIHGLEEVQGAKYLVLEFVDGRPLSDVLQSGALPVPEALAIARQIADALAAAHDRGIIHRDLKPGNLMVTAEGQVKVLDFGLGKAIEAEPASSTSNSPTMTLAATQQGIILGTAGYMSPEQAKGRAADKRADVWAFGCVLFEMLTGARAFEGEDVTETIAAIVRGEPDWKKLPANLPPHIRTLVQRALVKDRADRFGDMSVVRYVLNEPVTAGTTTSAVTAAPGRRAIGWPLVAGIAAASVLLTALAMQMFGRRAASTTSDAVRHLTLTLPDGDELDATNMGPLAISPDGTTVAYVGLHAGKTQLFVRQLADREATPIDGTDGARSPFFSPDSGWIGFFAQSKLKKVTVTGTGLRDVADAREPRGGTWSKDDTIYFAPTNRSGLSSVPASGGAAVPLTTLDSAQGEVSHRWPHVLPDGRTLVYNVWRGPGPDEHLIVRLPLDKKSAPQVLVQGGDTPSYASVGDRGFLLYGHFDKLFALPWTPSQRDVTGVAPLTLPPLPRIDQEGASNYVVSTEGTLAYVAGGPTRREQRLVWVDRHGKAEPLPLPDRAYLGAAISPDGTQAAIEIEEGVRGLWLYDFTRQTMTPFMTRGGSSQAPVWTSDSKRIIYRATRHGVRNVYWKAADGTGDEEALTKKPGVLQTPESVTSDGQWLVFLESGTDAGSSLWRIRLTGDRALEPLPATSAWINGRVSPNGQWIAFESTSSGRLEVIVAPFPGLVRSGRCRWTAVDRRCGHVMVASCSSHQRAATSS